MKVALTCMLLVLSLTGCTCLNVYPKDPQGDSIRGRVFVNGTALNRTNAPTVVDGLKVYVNYEVEGDPITRDGVAYISLNGKPFKKISYNKQNGFKSLGEVDMTRSMLPGLNEIEIGILFGKDGSSMLRGSRMALATPGGGAGHVCLEGDNPPTWKKLSFQVDYRPKA